MTDQREPHTDDRIDIDEHIEADPAEVLDYLADPDRRPFGRDDYLTLGNEVAREATAEGARIAWDATVPDEAGAPLPGTVEILVRPEGIGTRILVTHRIHTAAHPLALAA
jgi:hypothetical protein